MSFTSEQGYLPTSIETIMLSIMDNVNTQFGTTYTPETFIGTNFYKYFYALAQRVQLNEVKTSEIFIKIQDYFALTNERISRPVNTNPGLISRLADAGYVASIKKPVDADAGKIFVAIDILATDPLYATKKTQIAGILRDSTVAGAVTQGTEVTALVLSNGQSFDFKYNLPNRITVHLRLTLTLSENNQVLVGDPDDTKALLLANIAARYRLGRNFEPHRYFGYTDAPWASNILLEWSTNGGTTWSSGVYDANYDDLFMLDLARVTLVEV